MPSTSQDLSSILKIASGLMDGSASIPGFGQPLPGATISFRTHDASERKLEQKSRTSSFEYCLRELPVNQETLRRAIIDMKLIMEASKDAPEDILDALRCLQRGAIQEAVVKLDAAGIDRSKLEAAGGGGFGLLLLAAVALVLVSARDLDDPDPVRVEVDDDTRTELEEMGFVNPR